MTKTVTLRQENWRHRFYERQEEKIGKEKMEKKNTQRKGDERGILNLDEG